MIKNFKYKIAGFGLLCLLIFFSACSDFLEVEPSGEIPEIRTVKEAKATLIGAYARMKTASYYGTDLITYGEVRGDDMATTKISDRTGSAYEFANLTPLNYTNIGDFWRYMYNELNRVNRALTTLHNGKIEVSTEADKDELANVEAQLYALRALAHFNLVRIHGEPYLKNKKAFGIVIADRVIAKEETPVRTTVEDAYNFIVADLLKAINSKTLNSKKTDGYINEWAAKSLLARVYLHMGEWEKAYKLSVDVIKNGGYSLISTNEYVDSWSKKSTSESIFEILSTENDNANREGIGYVMKPRNSASKGYGAMVVSEQFYALLKEDPKDVRLGLLQKSDVNDYGYLAKYPGRDDNIYVNNIRVIRLSDVYLMAAEAGLYAGEADASTYLNAIRKRANPEAADITATAELIEKERRKELVGEGHRFFDIIRNLGTKTVERKGQKNYPITSYMLPVISWNNKDTYRLIMPIPSKETDANHNIQQNSGYKKN